MKSTGEEPNSGFRLENGVKEIMKFYGYFTQH